MRPEHFRSAGEEGATVALGHARITDSAFFGGHHRCHLLVCPLKSDPS
ncbi:hypothetical protein MKJ03_20535 (plasmid) [Rhizobium sp. SSM4.3]|uniref:Uncharacterized protein n=1 Tax=Peteryoungia algae TaxID=2919917 RepID=A0ABT0D5N8_9HYPH|nr:hypothetical protein [Rhizobium sp. SSM4.3]MCJ8240726.1 hypothetical protein [Rhizobium sp. SSM4.3]